MTIWVTMPNTIGTTTKRQRQASPQSTAQVSVQAPAPSTSSVRSVSFVTSAQFEAMNDKWAEHFARFEALLSRGNVFSTPKTSASVSSHPVLSDQLFINPSARPTGPVVYPAEQDVKLTKTGPKAKKKSHKSSMMEKSKDTVVIDPVPASSIPGPGDDMQEPVFRPVVSDSSSFTGQEVKSTGPVSQTVSSASQTGQGSLYTGHSVHYSMAPTFTTASDSAGAMAHPGQEYRDPPEHPISDEDFSDEDNSEEGEVSSDNLEKQEQTEDMTFLEISQCAHLWAGTLYLYLKVIFLSRTNLTTCGEASTPGSRPV